MSRPKANQISSRWRQHYEILRDLRNRLVRQRESGLAEMAHPAERHHSSLMDVASEEFDRVLALSLLSKEQDALYEIEAAMHRIEEGSYGICEISGEPIPSPRLKAIPWTRFRKEAAERMERQKVSRESSTKNAPGEPS